ncbi:2-phospho-L-lactate transferase CofD family protein [Staphylococcus aureus]
MRDEMDMPHQRHAKCELPALSDSESVLSQLFQYRFEENQISGHSLGNLLITIWLRYLQ